MLDLIEAAINDENNQEYSFYLEGDLSQMSTQKNFLQKEGFSTKQNNVYPCLQQKDVKPALELIWKHRVEGWWHYKKKYVELGICEAADFDQRLQRT